MKKVTEIVAELARPVVEEHGCTLWDVEYVREAGQWYLRLLIDKQGGVDNSGLRGHLARRERPARRGGPH